MPENRVRFDRLNSPARLNEKNFHMTPASPIKDTMSLNSKRKLVQGGNSWGEIIKMDSAGQTVEEDYLQNIPQSVSPVKTNRTRHANAVPQHQNIAIKE